jgi:hypothetical protein
MRILGNGNVGIGTTSPAAKLSTQLATASGGLNGIGSAWDSTYAVFGNAGSTTGAGVGLAYDITNDAGIIVSVAPNTAWKPLKSYAASYNWFTGGTEKMTMLDSGNVGIGMTSPTAKAHINQSSTTAAIPVLTLDQADISEEMIEFVTTIGTGNAIEAVAAKTLTTTHFIKVTLPGNLTRYIPCGTIA